MALTTGLEYEVKITDRLGYLANRSDVFLQPKYSNSFSKEGKLMQIEIHGAPQGAKNLIELGKDFRDRVQLAYEVAEDNDLLIVPGSEYGAGRGEINASSTRLQGYEKIIGREKLMELLYISGTHMHTSQHPTRTLDQYHINFALGPLISAITSTSPVKYDGQTGLNNYRVNLVRNEVFTDPELGAKLLEYPTTIAGMFNLRQKVFDSWLKQSGMSEEEFRSIGFAPENTGYDSVRKKDDINTFEQRDGDSAPVDLVISAIALLKGVQEHGLRDACELAIDSNLYGQPKFLFQDKLLVLPSYRTLLEMESGMINEGTKNILLRNFLYNALPFAAKGLTAKEEGLLQPCQDILNNNGKNIANEMLDYLKTISWKEGDGVEEWQAAKLNLWNANRNLEGLDTLDKIL